MHVWWGGIISIGHLRLPVVPVVVCVCRWVGLSVGFLAFGVHFGVSFEVRHIRSTLSFFVLFE